MLNVVRHELAKRDLAEQFVYLAENAGFTIAEKYLTAADESFLTIAGNPNIGRSVAVYNLELTGLRKWHVERFDKYLIFYMPSSDRISIMRVLHSAQDWWNLLGYDE